MPSNKELVAQNAKKVLSFKDVVRDVYHNIAPSYQTYVLQSNDGTVRQYKTKTYMVGNLNDPSHSSKFMPNLKGLARKYGRSSHSEQHKDVPVHPIPIHRIEDYEEDSRFDADNTETEVTELEYDHQMMHDNVTSDDEELGQSQRNGMDRDRADKIFEDFGDLNAGDLHSNDVIVPTGDLEAATTKTPDSSTNLLRRNSSESVEKQGQFQLIDMQNGHSDDGDDESDQSSDDALRQRIVIREQ